MSQPYPSMLRLGGSLRDDESERMRECLRVLGPATEEQGFAIRRQIAGLICLRAARPFAHENMRCDPTNGDIIDEEKRRIMDAMQSALGPCEFTPEVSFSNVDRRIHIDVLPREFPGPPWEVEQRKAAEAKLIAEIENRPSFSFEGQNR